MPSYRNRPALSLLLFLFSVCYPYFFLIVAAADVHTADDVDAGMFYSGLWVPDGDPNTFGHHDTWTNQSGAAVTFNFIGMLFPLPPLSHTL